MSRSSRNNSEWITEIAAKPPRQWALINPETELPYLRIAGDRSELVPLLYPSHGEAFQARRAMFQSDGAAPIEAWPPIRDREARVEALDARLAPPAATEWPANRRDEARPFGALELALAVALLLLALAFFGGRVFHLWGGGSIL